MRQKANGTFTVICEQKQVLFLPLPRTQAPFPEGVREGGGHFWRHGIKRRAKEVGKEEEEESAHLTGLLGLGRAHFPKHEITIRALTPKTERKSSK